MTLPSEVSVRVSASPAMPKSLILACPLRLTRMFCGLTSRWMTPR